MRQIITYEKAYSLLAPLYDTLSSCMQSGFEEHLKIKVFANTLGRQVIYENRTKANIIHDHLKAHVRENFGNNGMFEVDVWNNIFGLKLSDELFIRFNKMDENRKISCTKTNQFLNYARQGTIAGFPDSPTLLFAGYKPDKTWSRIQGMYIICPDNENMIHWSLELNSLTGVEQLNLYDRNDGRRSRVKLKGEEIYKKLNIKKTGTEDQPDKS